VSEGRTKGGAGTAESDMARGLHCGERGD
jgi:hypothetical protein